MAPVTCPNCQAVVSLLDEGADFQIRCQQCDTPLVVRQTEPDGAAVPSPPPALAQVPEPAPPRPRLPMRTRRLLADAEQMQHAFGSSSLIRIQSTVGDPPELYRIEYRVRGLARGADGQPVSRYSHLVEIQLTSEYPRVSPRCKVLTPIFHPNIDATTICVGDHWAAGERLVDLVMRIGEMIMFQAYNIKSPLDGEAAMWADLNQRHLPLDNCNLLPAEAAGLPGGRGLPEPAPQASATAALLEPAHRKQPAAAPEKSAAPAPTRKQPAAAPEKNAAPASVARHTGISVERRRPVPPPPAAPSVPLPARAPAPARKQPHQPPKTVPQPTARRRSGLLVALAAALFVGGGALGLAVYRIATDKGELVVEIGDPQVEVALKQKGIVIQDGAGGRKYQLKPGSQELRSGTYEIEVSEAESGLHFSTRKFIIQRGDKVAVQVTLRPPAVAARPAEEPKVAEARPNGGAVRQEPAPSRPPAAETVGEVRRFEGHTAPVRAVAFSPDGRRAVAGSSEEASDGTIHLWDLTTGKEIRTLGAPEHVRVTRVAFSPDGHRLVSGGEDPSPRLWDVDTGKEVRQFGEPTRWWTHAVAFSPNGRQVLTGSDDATVRLWDADTGMEVRKFEGHTGFVDSVAFAPDGKRVLSGSFDKTVRLWDVETGQELKRFEGHEGRVVSVALSPNGRYALSGDIDEKTVRLWDVDTGKEVRAFTGHESPITSVVFSPDGRRALSGSLDRTLRLWDVETGKELHCFRGHGDTVWSVAFSPDGRYALSGSADKTLRLWRLPEPDRAALAAKPDTQATGGSEVRQFQGHEGWGIRGVAFTPNGRQAPSSDTAGHVILWDLASGKEVCRLEGHQGEVCDVSIAADGRHAATGGVDNTARVWDLQSGKQLQLFQDNAPGGIEGVSISPDSRRVLTSNSDGIIRLWDVETGKQLRSLTGHTGPIRRVVFTRDGHKAVSGGRDQTVRLWDVETGAEIKRFVGHDGWIASVDVSRDGRHIVSGSLDKTARVWDVDTGKEVCRFEGHQAIVEGVAFTPDGRHVVSGGSDKKVRLWDAATARELYCFEGRPGDIYCLAVSPDGGHALSGGSDLVLRLWRLPDSVASPQQKSVAPIPPTQPIQAGNRAVGRWKLNQPAIGESELQITEKDGKLEVQEIGLGSVKSRIATYEDGLLVIHWGTPGVTDHVGYWLLYLNKDDTHGEGKAVFTHYPTGRRYGVEQKIQDRTVLVVEGVTIDRMKE